MTHVSVYCALFAVLSCTASSASERPSASSIALFLDFDREPSRQVMDSMKAEVERIMSPSRLRFEWHMLREERRHESFADLAVIHFKGACEQSAAVQAFRVPPVLASTQVADGHVLPFADVDCSALGRYISTVMPQIAETTRDRLLGRALGRVLAHELYHIFGETQKHAPSGIARAYHSREDLVSRDFNFSERECDLFRGLKSRSDAANTDVEEDPATLSADSLTPLSQ